MTGRCLILLDAVENLFEFDLHHNDGFTTLCDSFLNLLTLAFITLIILVQVQLGKLVAELLLCLHHRLQFDEDRCRHVEEVVFSIKLFFVVSESAASLTKLVNSLLHFSSFELLQTLRSWSRPSNPL